MMPEHVHLYDPRLPARFWDKVHAEPNTGCWLWTAAADDMGYGRFGLGRRSEGIVLSHRHCYSTLVAEVPRNMDIDHLCRTPSCCNPAHLEPVPRIVNIMRGVRKTKQTQCKRGHALYVEHPDRQRRCRTCVADAQRRYHAKKRARAAAET